MIDDIEVWDAIVCGAGPAGLVACYELLVARPTLRVLLLDRRDPWREPVSCAEAVSSEGLHRLVEVNPAWIRGPVDGVVFVSPDGTRIRYDQTHSGLIIDRARMHKELAQRCGTAGAQIDFRTEVLRLEPSVEGIAVLVRTQAGERTLRARAVVDATGAGGRATKALDSIEDGRFDLESAVFGLVEGIPHLPNHIELWFGSEFFPGGYGWVFPRDGRTANVGLVVGRGHGKGIPPRKLLQEWVAKQWSSAQLGSVYGGAIACGQSKEPIATHGIFKAGDAASMVNPISRAGILESMKAGRAASAHILRYLDCRDVSQHQEIYASYQKEWMRIQGQSHLRLAQAKPAFAGISDAVFNKAAHRISRIPTHKRTMPRIFWATLISNPSLLWKMRSLM